MAEGESDLAYIQSKGTLVAGITDFAPMDYRDGREWTGFDAELAEALQSILDKKADTFIQAAYEDGSINTLAEKYGIQNAVLE